MAVGARTDPLYHESMNLTDRDLQILRLVGRFGQLSSGHIRDLVFDGLSDVPCKRRLAHLTKHRALARIERRTVGGTGAGSGQYVYQLGSLGWQIVRREGRYWPYRAVNYHSLAVGDVYVDLKRLERVGQLRVEFLSAEPDTWASIAGAELRPDLHVILHDLVTNRIISLWIEVDMGTERQKQLKDKMARYYHAFLHSTEELLEGMGIGRDFPLVAFLVPDDDRLNELRHLVARGADEAQALFDVRLKDDLAGLWISGAS